MGIKKYICFIIALLMFMTFVGCKKETVEDGNNLKVVVYNGGYGSEWIVKMLEKFAEENGDVIIEPKADNNLLLTLTADLEDKKNNVDLYFSHGIPWENYAVEDLIEPLDDLYESEFSEGVKFKDRVIDDALAASKFEGHYYKVPWTQGVGGIAYNMSIMEANNWDVPKTYNELKELCEKIVTANLKSGSDTIAPFIWPGSDSWLWDYVVYPWWGQLAGTDKISDLMTFQNGADTYNPSTNWKEMKEAYQYWYDLIAGNKNYSFSGSAGTDKFTAQATFVSGKAVMMPNAHWLYQETKLSAPDGLKIELYPAPTLPNAKIGYEKVNYSVGFGDSIILPKNSKNKTMAKKFLTFLAREDNCKLFSQYAVGTSLAFKYDMSEASDNKYAQSVSTLLKDCVSFNVYSSFPLAVILGSEKISPWPNNTYYYRESFQDNTYTPEYVMNNVYDYVTMNWNNWKNAAGY